ncbi:hypothetical protein K505DRAFT_400901 [Melanomma pulvis-pyrius CBS 109.77]|uniref:Secreted protein n=1 Tax=Melanomma pulvis-pyrius CBS 109.77 TaxID=1314802 RepID=A0A6A6XJJ2_9PLEO|nr:hypothetical protein K505DRAFT_400901 [Melanomma pulvis-pyrius CBS 109.77]
MKFVLLLAGLLALVTAAPTSPPAFPVSADAKVEAFSKRESLTDATSQVSSILATRNGVRAGAISDISSLLNAAKTSFEMTFPGLVYLCSEHEYRGDCAAFSLNKCVNFDGMSKKAKSIMQAAGAVCAYWSHDDCESGGATTLIKIYSDDHEELRPTLSPLDSMLTSGRCFPPAEWYQHQVDDGEVRAPRGYPLDTARMTKDVTPGSISLCSEHDHKGSCKNFIMGTEGSCVRFNGVYMKAKSLFQPKGTVCQYWPHDECEDGGGPATSLLNIYSFEHDEDRRTLFPYDGLFATGKCWGADQFAAI